MKTGPKPRDAADRILARIEKVTESGCWIFMGALKNGYAATMSGPPWKHASGHRLVYEKYVGKIPNGLDIDHLCRVRSCVNPTHLRVVTRKENLLAAGSLSFAKTNSDKTLCLRGHEFNDENTRTTPAGRRECRICRREHDSKRPSGWARKQARIVAAMFLLLAFLSPGIVSAQAIGTPGQEWNPAFWTKYRELLAHARSIGANVEVNVIDTWYCKHAQWGDQPITWPQEDVDACGRRPSPEQERFIRKVVSESCDAPHVIWITDNEGDQIQGDTPEWYDWVRTTIRDAEQQCPTPTVRMIGTNNPTLTNLPFDYFATHAGPPLVVFGGRFSENNEHNDPSSPEAEHAAFCQAQGQGLHWWFWRAEMNAADMERTLDLFGQGCGGPVGCFAPHSEDPLWVTPPVHEAGQMKDAVLAAEAAVGERCGTDHQGSLNTLGLLAAELRKQGHCASGPWTDAVAILNPSGKWEEYHAVTFASGCWSQDPAQLPKFTWTYNGAPPAATCPQDVPTVDQISCKEHQATNHIYDCTPKANGQPILPEGDPNRSACELKAMGGQWPVYSVSGEALTTAARENPMQFQLKGTGSGVVSCVVPVGTFCNLSVSQ